MTANDKGFTVYLLSAEAYEGQLIAKAINKEGLEIGRSVIEVKLDSDDTNYFMFTFDAQMDQQTVEKYTIDQKS